MPDDIGNGRKKFFQIRNMAAAENGICVQIFDALKIVDATRAEFHIALISFGQSEGGVLDHPKNTGAGPGNEVPQAENGDVV
jgi:hypothetical protein